MTSTKTFYITLLFIFFISSNHVLSQNKCENLKHGKFYSYSEVETLGSVYQRNGEIQKEMNIQNGDSAIWKIKWLDDCNYTLKLISGNGYTEQQIANIKQHTIFIKVLEVTDKYYTYESHFDNLTGRLIISDTIWLQEKLSFVNNSYWPIIVYNEKGDKINLYEDGTWKMAKTEVMPASATPNVSSTNRNVFTKDRSATYLVKSKKINFGVYINPDKWGVTKGGINEPAEFNFSMKEYDIFASLITERTPVPLDNLADLLLQNAQTQTPDVEIIKKEYRIVNGLKLLALQMRMTIKGMKYIYFSYNFSNQHGAVQLTSVTNENLFKKNYLLIENFLNGLTLL